MLAAGAIRQIADKPIFDVGRVGVIVTSVLIICLLLYLIYKPRRAASVKGDRLWCIGVIGYACVAISQEAGQLGHHLLWWRLPAFLIINTCITLAIYFRIKAEAEGVEDANAENAA